jgi:hypothetical protein
MDAGETEAYAHIPLESPERQVRLLRIISPPGQDNEYSLETYNLDSPKIPYFYALSYEWGPEHPVHPITIDGKVFQVRQNLKDFLDRLAGGGETYIKPMWIDAICICQDILPERNAQVTIMGKIFKAASLVVTWIGTQPRDNGILSDIETTLREWQSSDEATRLFNGTLSQPSKILSPREPYGRMWNHLKLLCEQSYWRRLWIIQEIALSDHILLCWGVDQISWSALSIAFNALYQSGRGRRLSAHVEGPWDVVAMSVPFSVWLRSEGYEPNTRLLKTMQTYKDSRCSVYHDKAYALTGISADAEKVQIDYEKSLTDLYADLMGLEARSPHCLRHSHLILQALGIDDRVWADGSVKSRTVDCHAEMISEVVAVEQIDGSITSEMLEVEMFGLAAQGNLDSFSVVTNAIEWFKAFHMDVDRYIKPMPKHVWLFCMKNRQIGVALSQIQPAGQIYRVAGLSDESGDILLSVTSGGRPISAAASPPQSPAQGDTVGAVTRVWLCENANLETSSLSEDTLSLSLADLYAIDHLLELDLGIVPVPLSPTDEPPSPSLPYRRAQSDAAARDLHRTTTSSKSIDEAIRRSSTWPHGGSAAKKGADVVLDGWYIDAIARSMRDQLFTGPAALGRPD